MATIVDPQPGGPTNFDQIAAFEARIGYPLPAPYRAFLLQYNGGHPHPDAFVLHANRSDEEDIVFCFFPLRNLSIGPIDVAELDGLRTWPLHCAWDDLQNDLENRYETKLDPPLLPIGTDGSSNYISLVLTGDNVGAVVFLDHETAEDWPLAPSFPAFMESLRPRERTDYHPALGSGSH
jgi:hypothetical protein